MRTYFQDVGGSQILNTTTQYPGNNGTPADTSTYVDLGRRHDGVPAHGRRRRTRGHAGRHQPGGLQPDQREQLADRDERHVLRVPPGQPRRLRQRAARTATRTAYCAYHTRGWGSGGDTPANDFVWADIPVNRGVVHDRRLRELERHGRQPGRHDAQLGGARAPGGDHRSARERLAGLDRRRRRERRQVQPQHGRRQRVLDDRQQLPRRAASETSSASSASGRTQPRWRHPPATAARRATRRPARRSSRRARPAGTSPRRSPRRRSRATTGTRSTTTSRSTTRATRTTPTPISDAISYPSGVSGPASVSLGDLAPHQTANGNLTATVTGGPLLDGTVLTTTFTSNFDDSTGDRAAGDRAHGDDDRRERRADTEPARRRRARTTTTR